METLPNGRKHHIIEESDTGSLDNTQVYVVPDSRQLPELATLNTRVWPQAKA